MTTKYTFEIKLGFQKGLDTSAFDFLKKRSDTSFLSHVVELYRTADIELKFLFNENDIRNDFTMTDEKDAIALFDKLSKTEERKYGNLIFCNKSFSKNNDNARGFLYNPISKKERGVIFVFLSGITDSNKEKGLIMTCAHEIGHLLNFDHIVDNNSEDNAYISTLHVSNLRFKKDINENWAIAASIARRHGYYNGLFKFPKSKELFPFPQRFFYERLLSQLGYDYLITPWGSPYSFELSPDDYKS